HRQETTHFTSLEKVLDVVTEWEVRQPVTVVRQKHLFSVQVRLDSLEPLSDIRLDSRVDKRNVPVVDIAIHQLEFFTPVGQDKVVRHTFVVIQEIVLDNVRFVPKA